MEKRFGVITKVILAVMLVVMFATASFSEPAHARRIKLSAALLEKMANEGDSGTFKDSIKACKAVAIFPALVKAGLGIGGMSGEGIVLVRDPKGGWKGPSYVSLVGGSFGLQIGVQETGLVLCVVNEDGLSVFTGGQGFKLGGDVSVAAGPVGRDASAATDSRAKASIYSYSMSSGAFIGMSIDGSTINVNRDANKAYWGSAIEANEALSKKASGEKIAPLIKALKALD